MAAASSFADDVGRRYTVGRRTVEIKNVIAEGGFGVVFLVVDFLGTPYALKRLYVNDYERLKECRNEIEIMSSLGGYKHIVKYIESSVRHIKNRDIHEILILMEYCPRSVFKRLQQGVHLSNSDVLQIFCDLCEAVAILHNCQTPVIHRDIKLENILLNSKNEYVLCDFGSATIKAYSIDTTNTQSILNTQEDINKYTTPSHRPPELIDLYSQPVSTIGTKIDIWAMGVTLYRLCFHQLPFGEGSLGSGSQAINIPEDTKFSKPIIALTHYCLTVNPNERPNIYQVASAAFQIAQFPCPVANKFGVSAPSISDLMESMQSRQTLTIPTKPVSVRNLEWVETTTIKPRQRPKPGQVGGSTNSTPTHQIKNDASQKLIDTSSSVQFSTNQPTITRSTTPSSVPPQSNPFGDDFSTFSFNPPTSNGANPQPLVNVSVDQSFLPTSNLNQVTQNNAPVALSERPWVSPFNFSTYSPFGDDFGQHQPTQLQGICQPHTSMSLQTDQHPAVPTHNVIKNTELDMFGAIPFSTSAAPRAFDSNMMWS